MALSIQVSSYFLVLIAGLVGRIAATTQGYLCYYYIQGNDKFYNLNGLVTSDPSKYSIQNVQIKTPKEGNVQANLIFNICGVKTDIQGCDGSVNTVGYVQVPGGSCYPMSKNAGNDITAWNYGAFDPSNSANDGITISGTTADTATAPFGISFQFKCDSSVTSDPTLSATYDNTNNVLQVTATHKDACGVEFLGPFAFLANYKWPILFVGLVLGCTLCFFGFRVFKYSLAILGFLIGLAWQDVQNENKIWMILGFSFLIACLASYFVYTMRNVGLFIAGCFLGVVVALQIYIIGLYKFEKSGSSLILYLTIGFMSVAIGTLAIWLKDFILMLTTSLGGAWLAVKCVGAVAGKYPNEFTLTKDIQYGKFDQVPSAYYVYLGAMVLLAITGLIYQCRLYKEIKENEESGKADYMRA